LVIGYSKIFPRQPIESQTT